MIPVSFSSTAFLSTGVLNDRFLEKGLFLSQTSNRPLSNDICLIINFRGKKIAAPQCQQA